VIGAGFHGNRELAQPLFPCPSYGRSRCSAWPTKQPGTLYKNAGACADRGKCRRCDGRLAHLLEAAHLRVSNPALALRAHHLHHAAHPYQIPPGAAEEAGVGGGEPRRPWGYTGEDQVNGRTAQVPLSLEWML
jgi:hypothetical protein